jgi:hypothetical protein
MIRAIRPPASIPCWPPADVSRETHLVAHSVPAALAGGPLKRTRRAARAPWVGDGRLHSQAGVTVRPRPDGGHGWFGGRSGTWFLRPRPDDAEPVTQPRVGRTMHPKGHHGPIEEADPTESLPSAAANAPAVGVRRSGWHRAWRRCIAAGGHARAQPRSTTRGRTSARRRADGPRRWPVPGHALGGSRQMAVGDHHQTASLRRCRTAPAHGAHQDDQDPRSGRTGPPGVSPCPSDPPPAHRSPANALFHVKRRLLDRPPDHVGVPTTGRRDLRSPSPGNARPQRTPTGIDGRGPRSSGRCPCTNHPATMPFHVKRKLVGRTSDQVRGTDDERPTADRQPAGTTESEDDADQAPWSCHRRSRHPMPANRPPATPRRAEPRRGSHERRAEACRSATSQAPPRPPDPFPGSTAPPGRRPAATTAPHRLGSPSATFEEPFTHNHLGMGRPMPSAPAQSRPPGRVVAGSEFGPGSRTGVQRAAPGPPATRGLASSRRRPSIPAGRGVAIDHRAWDHGGRTHRGRRLPDRQGVDGTLTGPSRPDDARDTAHQRGPRVQATVGRAGAPRRQDHGGNGTGEPVKRSRDVSRNDPRRRNEPAWDVAGRGRRRWWVRSPPDGTEPRG